MLTAHNLEEHRAALTGHCYRMLGSAAEADDAVQETLIRAWKSLDRFEGRASLRTWLHRIATRVCLDAIDERSRRARPMDLRPAGAPGDPLSPRPASEWIEPIPDVQAIPADADPAERAALRQSIRLAFVAALQLLPPRQRAMLLLADVLGWSAAEIAESLDTTVPAVNSALQRARATLASRDVSATSGEPDPALLARYVDAFERFDVDALTALLHEEATFSMPPFDLWLRGPAAVHSFLLGPGAGCRGSRLVPVQASGSPAFGHYKPTGAGYHAWALLILETAGDRVTGWNSFLDVETWFPRFGLPLDLGATAHAEPAQPPT
jgi:RNA polymerase sigma-70 factor (ECF subfamily)